MTHTQPAPSHRLSTKLFYGSGSVAFGVKDNGFNAFLLLYYNQVLGLPAGLVGAALALALVVDAGLDPVIGYISDNTRSRWGRRHPYMYAAAIPASLSYLLLWLPPAGLGQAGLLAYLIVITILVRSFISLYEIPSAALGPELSSDYDERTSYMAYRYLFGWIGGVTMYILAFSIFLRPNAAHPVGQLNPDGYRNYALASAAVMFVSILASSLGTRSAIPHLQAPPTRRRIPLRQVLAEVASALGNPSAVALIAASVVSGVAAGVTFALQSYFNTYFWQLPSQQIATLGAASYLSAFGALLVAPFLSRRLGKKAALIGVSIASVVIGPSAIVLRLLGLFPANGSPVLVPLLFVIGAVAVSLSIVPPMIGGSMMADVVEDNQVKTGRRSEGVLFAASAFLLKCVSGTGLLAGALVLGLVHFPQHAAPGHVAPQVLSRLGLVYVASVVALSALSIALVSRYRITRQSHAANLEALRAIAAEMVLEQPRLHFPGPP